MDPPWNADTCFIDHVNHKTKLKLADMSDMAARVSDWSFSVTCHYSVCIGIVLLMRL